MYMVGGWPTPLKNINQLGWLFPIYGKMENVPNHQPENIGNTHKNHQTIKHGLGITINNINHGSCNKNKE